MRSLYYDEISLLYPPLAAKTTLPLPATIVKIAQVVWKVVLIYLDKLRKVLYKQYIISNLFFNFTKYFKYLLSAKVNLSQPDAW